MVPVNGVDLIQDGDGHVGDHGSVLDCRGGQGFLVLVHQGGCGGRGFSFSLGFLLKKRFGMAVRPILVFGPVVEESRVLQVSGVGGIVGWDIWVGKSFCIGNVVLGGGEKDSKSKKSFSR